MKSFVTFSQKQRRVLSWWCPGSPYAGCDAIICDGAVRSGKTFCMAISFFLWASRHFSGKSFALCGQTQHALERNLIRPVLPYLQKFGFGCREVVSKNQLILTLGGRENIFYLFGGSNEGAAARIQGVTLAGVLFDETALMPQSFVEQALARCSIAGSRFWFNCNPESPHHWFYTEWIQKAAQKNALYLHFTMEDNLSLPPKIRRRYEGLYTGAFYERFVLGNWVSASGLVYPMFSMKENGISAYRLYDRYYVSVDYGTVNPTSMGLWGRAGEEWHRIREFYYDSRQEQAMKTDEEYYHCLEELASGVSVEAVIVDPSAASFIECIRRHGAFPVVPANNEVLSGIRRVGGALRGGILKIHDSCKDAIREFSLYSWDEKAQADAPKKEFDHAMDEIRYFVNTVLRPQEDFFVLSSSREAEPKGGRR